MWSGTCARRGVPCCAPSTNSRNGPAHAIRQKATRRTQEGTQLHSFRTLLENLANVTRNVCRAKGREGSRQSEFELDAQLSAKQARAMELLKGIRA